MKALSRMSPFVPMLLKKSVTNGDYAIFDSWRTAF